MVMSYDPFSGEDCGTIPSVRYRVQSTVATGLNLSTCTERSTVILYETATRYVQEGQERTRFQQFTPDRIQDFTRYPFSANKARQDRMFLDIKMLKDCIAILHRC